MKNILIITLFVLFTGLTAAQKEFSQENAAQLVKTLSLDIGPRPMGSPAERLALEFAAQKFREYGCDTAYIMKMAYTDRVNTNSGIAIGIKRGATQRLIVLGGHIDSAGPEIPGADDDGSGSATVMELARVLCGRQLQSTLVFCCWGGEEQGLEGSKYFVDHFEQLDSVALMLQVDMANGQGLIELDPDTHGQSAPRWLVRTAVEEFYKLGYRHLRYPTHFFSINYSRERGAGSDHESFLKKGIPAIDFSTDVSKPIHTPGDNFENFDPAGLKRSGDLILKLVERFDAGVPSHDTEQYWLWLLGATPLFVAIPTLWAFLLMTFVVSIVTFISVRNRRERVDSPVRIRWSGVKMILYALIIVALGWLSSDLVGLIRGVRHPWMTDIPSFFVLGGIAAIIGVWISLKIVSVLPLTKCPYVFYKRAAIMLAAYMILFGIINIKLAVEPAVGLLLVSLAMLFRNALVKFVFLSLSPWWTLRLLFSEWSPLFFRGGGAAMSSDMGSILMFNGLMIVLLTLLILPFLYAVAAVIRDSATLHRTVPVMSSFRAGSGALVAFAAMTGFLLSKPVYNMFWQKDVRVDQTYDFNHHTQLVNIHSGEYLSGLAISHGGLDTVIEGRTTRLQITPRAPFDTTWLAIDRHDDKVVAGDTTLHRVNVVLNLKFRPYTVNVGYAGNHDQLRTFMTPWKFASEGGLRSIRWYSFPDTLLSIPVEFRTVGEDSVRESIEVTFDSLAYPMTLNNELSYIIPRTRFSQHVTYRK